MRIRAILAAIVVGSGVHAYAQAPDETPDQKRPQPPAGDKMRGGPREGMKERFLKSLSPETRQRFESARDKALKDPTIQELRQKSEAANRDFFEAMRAKMQEIDPGLAELIKDHAPGRPDRPDKGDRPNKEDRPRRDDGDDGMQPPPKGDRKDGKRGGGGPESGMSALSDAERDQLGKARATAKEDPAVVAAQKKKEGATDPEARRAASEEYRAAMHAAMLKADPSLEPVLKKLAPPGLPPAPEGGMGGQMGADPE